MFFHHVEEKNRKYKYFNFSANSAIEIICLKERTWIKKSVRNLRYFTKKISVNREFLVATFFSLRLSITYGNIVPISVFNALVIVQRNRQEENLFQQLPQVDYILR